MSTSPHGGSDPLVPDSDVLVDNSLAVQPPDVDAPFDQTAPYLEAPASALPLSRSSHAYDLIDRPDDRESAGASVASSAYVDDSYEPRARRPRVRATVYESLPGMPGRGVVLLAAFATAAVVGLDFGLTGGLSFFFDLAFVVICLVAAMAVRGHDLFTTGVLPPLVFGGTVAVVAAVAPDTFVAAGGISKVYLTGLTSHAGALAFGYGTALVTVAGRAAHHRRR
jgi:hypothetical protein